MIITLTTATISWTKPSKDYYNCYSPMAKQIAMFAAIILVTIMTIALIH